MDKDKRRLYARPMSKRRNLTSEEMEWADRLKRIWNAKKSVLELNQDKVGAEMGITQGAVGQYINGKIPLNDPIVIEFARILRVDVREIKPVLADRIDWTQGRHKLDTEGMELREMSAQPYSTASEDTVAIHKFDVRASMGSGELQNQHPDIIETIRVSRSWLRQNVNPSNMNNLALITAFGDSMEGTFNDGDVLLVDRGVAEVKIDAIYVLGLKDEVFIKRLQRRPDGSLLMISDNKNYEPYTIANGDLGQFSVMGRVLLAWNARKL